LKNLKIIQDNESKTGRLSVLMALVPVSNKQQTYYTT